MSIPAEQQAAFAAFMAQQQAQASTLILDDVEDVTPQVTEHGIKRKIEKISTCDADINGPAEKMLNEMRNLASTKEWVSSYSKWTSIVWEVNQDMYVPTGDIVPMVPYIADVKMKYPAKLNGFDINGPRRIIDNVLMRKKVSKWGTPADLTRALTKEYGPELGKQVQNIVRLANVEGGGTIVSYHKGHWHMLIGHNDNIYNKQAYRNSCQMTDVSRKCRQQVDPLAYLVYMLSDQSKKYFGANQLSGVRVVEGMLRYMKEANTLNLDPFEEPGREMEEVSVPQQSYGVVPADREAAVLADDYEQVDYECESERLGQLFAASNNCLNKTRTKASQGKYDLKCEYQEKQIKMCIQKRCYTAAELYQYKELRNVFMKQKAAKELILTTARQLACEPINRLQYVMEMCNTKYVKHGMTLFFDLPLEWQNAVVAVCALILLKQPVKTSLVWITGAPDSGKSYIFSKGLDWLKPINKSIQMTGTFAFGGLANPGLICMQDDVGVVFDTETQIELFKNATSMDNATVNPKYGGKSPIFPQPMVVLSNKDELEMIGITQSHLHRNAINARMLLHTTLHGKCNNMDIEDVHIMWQSVLKVIIDSDFDVINDITVQCGFDVMSTLYANFQK